MHRWEGRAPHLFYIAPLHFIPQKFVIRLLASADDRFFLLRNPCKRSYGLASLAAPPVFLFRRLGTPGRVFMTWESG
jgi:hypothetical protein